jgi:hypothetical protein
MQGNFQELRLLCRDGCRTTEYKRKVQKEMRSRYRNHIVKVLLETLTRCSRVDT